MKKKLLSILSIMLLLVLAGCAKPPVATTSKAYEPYLSWSARQAQLNGLQNWTIKSVLSVQQQNQASFVSLHWQQQGDHFEQRLSGPFSIGGVRISGVPGQVTLWRTEQDKITAKTPEELIQQVFRWQLPISNLHYWVRGIPAANVPAQEQFDSHHRLSVLTQSGWTIEYLDYTRVNNMDLPREMLLIGAQLQVKMVIQQWQVI